MTARLKEQEKKIYLITARHDYCEDGSPVEFDDDELIPVKGMPMYEAMAKILKRLHPVIHIIEKKMSAKNPVLSDIDSFILSMIGDEKQRDYEAVININNNFKG